MKGFTKLFGAIMALVVMVSTSSLLQANPDATKPPLLYKNCETGQYSTDPYFGQQNTQQKVVHVLDTDKTDHKETSENSETQKKQESKNALITFDFSATPDFATMSVEDLRRYVFEFQQRMIQVQKQIISGAIQETPDFQKKIEKVVEFFKQASQELQKKVAQLSIEEQEAFKKEMLQRAQELQQAVKQAQPGVVGQALDLIKQSFVAAASIKLVFEPVFNALGNYVISPIANYTVVPVVNALTPAATYVKHAIFGAPTAAYLAQQAEIQAQREIAVAVGMQAHSELMHNVGEKIGTNKLFSHKYVNFLKEKSPEILHLGATIATFTALYKLAGKASEVTGVGAAVSNWYYGAEHTKEIEEQKQKIQEYRKYRSLKRNLKKNGATTKDLRELKKQKPVVPELSLGAYLKTTGAGVGHLFATLACGYVSHAMVGGAFGYLFAK